jgi:hypothetical protein
MAAIDRMNKYGSELMTAKFRNILAVSLVSGKGMLSGISTLRKSHKGPQPSFIW